MAQVRGMLRRIPPSTGLGHALLLRRPPAAAAAAVSSSSASLVLPPHSRLFHQGTARTAPSSGNPNEVRGKLCFCLVGAVQWISYSFTSIFPGAVDAPGDDEHVAGAQDPQEGPQGN